jgi:hypothetical protein
MYFVLLEYWLDWNVIEVKMDAANGVIEIQFPIWLVG